MDGWIDAARSPIKSGIPPEQTIFVWHALQGTMTVVCAKWNENPLYSHWRRIDNDAWVLTADRMPEKADADETNCVISRNIWGEVRTTGWHRFRDERWLTAWQTPPEPPVNYR